MSGIFHSMKKAVVKGDARPDLEFQEAKGRFDAYCATLLKLKGNMANYLTSATSLYVTSSQICQDFAVLLDDPSHPNDFTDHSNSMRVEVSNGARRASQRDEERGWTDGAAAVLTLTLFVTVLLLCSHCRSTKQ